MDAFLTSPDPLPPFERFEGSRGAYGNALPRGEVIWTAWLGFPMTQLRVRITPVDGTFRWSVWAGYPGDRDSWRFRINGRSFSFAEALAVVQSILTGNRILTGGIAPSVPVLQPPNETFEEYMERSRAERDRIRKEDERARRQRIHDTGEGYYPELLTEWPMSRAGHEGRPWKVLYRDGTIEHRTETIPSWGRNHHLRYFVGDEPVAGLTLIARRPWGGLQSAKINTVFTHPDHRRLGYAQALLQHARGVFRRVVHSRDLTGAGRKWKAGVERNRRSF